MVFVDEPPVRPDPLTMENATMRRAAALCLLLVMSGCADESRPTPIAPTVPGVPSATVTPTPTFTLSGVVIERLSGRPVQGAKVWVEPFSLSRELRSWPPPGLRTTPSDGAGRYTISGLPRASYWMSTAQTWGDAYNAPYMHQCVTTVTVGGDTTLDVTISSTADLVALNASTGPTPPNSRIVSGRVFEITADGRQPLRNIWVGWEGSGSGDTFAETRTDVDGHYRLCGLPRDRITLGAAPAYGNVFYTPVAPGSDAILDVEIKR
jgi:hypothetical protein